MLFHVMMTVKIPHDADETKIADLKAREKARAEALQREGKWRHLWRTAGQYANVSIFDVETNSELHELLSSLPLFPFMDVTVAPLCRHPSSIHDDDR